MTLWCIFRSPLILGGDLPSNDAATTALISNDEVLAVDQNSIGNHQVYDRADVRAWVADVPHSKDHYVAVFNLAGYSRKVDMPWSDFAIRRSQAKLRDLWQKKDLGPADGVHVILRPHASVFYRVSEQ
jgi:hypothetical protein